MKLAITILKQKELDIKHNMENAARVASNAFEDDADIVLLPEYFNIGLKAREHNRSLEISTWILNKSYSRSYYPFIKNITRRIAISKNYIAKDLEEYLKPLREKAQSYSGKYIAGSLPLKEHKNIYNTGFIIDDQGDIIIKQGKMHPYDYEHHIVDQYDRLNTISIKGFRTAIMICWDPFEGELENGINKKVQLVLSPTIFPIYSSALHYSQQRAQHLRKYLYFGCSTLIPEDLPKIPGGAFITGPDINSLLHEEGYLIEKLNAEKLKKPDHKLKKIILDYNENPHYLSYRSLSEAFRHHEFTQKSIKDHEKEKE